MLLQLLLPLLLCIFFALLPPTSTPLPSSFPSGPALLLTAHPDDETMFFAPLILSLVAEGREVLAACMSTGDAVGLGYTRKNELIAAYRVLGVNESSIALFDHPQLRDGMTTEWSPHLVADLVQPLLDQHHIQTVITFDSGGVSSHPNHIALSQTLPLLRAPTTLPDSTPISLQKYQLISLPLRTKYLSFVPLLASSIPSRLHALIPSAVHLLLDLSLKSTSAAQHIQKEAILESASPVRLLLHTTSPLRGYKQALRAMKEHWSQLVWFRWGYVGVSRYMWEGWYEMVD